ncbi:MAG TPA: hypothetical protein VFE24_09565 [Pirellulales bacterium]|jgi:hypothetical protein|nr:hypothetical protein [Pirellulales bacterium]
MSKFFTACAIALLLGPATARASVVADDNFSSYAPASTLGGQGGWTDTSTTTHATILGAGGVAGSVGLSSADNSIYWTSHPWNWATLSVGDVVVLSADFQASSGATSFDDDRIGWGDDTTRTSSFQFGVQIDTADGGLNRYFRDMSGTGVTTNLIPSATIGTIVPNDWYHMEMDVTKLTSALGANGAQLVVKFSHLDITGNIIGSPVTATVNVDTSLYRALNSTVDPIYKDFNTQSGGFDNAHFSIASVPEPSSLVLGSVGALLLIGFCSRRQRQTV